MSRQAAWLEDTDGIILEPGECEECSEVGPLFAKGGKPPLRCGRCHNAARAPAYDPLPAVRDGLRVFFDIINAEQVEIVTKHGDTDKHSSMAEIEVRCTMMGQRVTWGMIQTWGAIDEDKQNDQTQVLVMKAQQAVAAELANRAFLVWSEG